MLDKHLFKLPGFRKVMIILFILAVVQSLCIVGQAAFLTIVLVHIWQLQKIVTLVIPMLLFFVCFTLHYFITWIEDHLSDHFSTSTVGYLKHKLLNTVITLGPKKVSSKLGSGTMITMCLEGLDQVEKYLNLILVKAVNLSVLPWIILVAVFCTNITAGIILLLVFPIVMIFMVILGLAAKVKSDQQYEGFKQMANNFVDALRGLDTLSALGLNKKYAQNVFNVSENYRKRTMRVLRVALLSTFALDFFSTISIAIVALFLGVGLINGQVNLSVALFVLILAPEYFTPIQDFGDDYHATLDGKNVLTHIYSIIDNLSKEDNKQLLEEKDKKFKPWNSNSTLEFHNMDFNYEDSKFPTLKDINFKAKGYEKIGIVGNSGVGKSTLLNIIGGFLKPSNTNKSIIVNGTKKNNLDYPNWQKEVSYIPQDPYIFSGTIADNISFYYPQATLKEIKIAAHEAGLDNFIKELKQGLNTKIGEGGRGISGGQAQRIALARTLLDKNRKIILLDEPTGHLDLETEYSLKNSMKPILNNHLVFLSTHRLHWMNDMDYILVLKNGKIVEQGTPQELKANSSEYNNLLKEIKGDNDNNG